MASRKCTVPALAADASRPTAPQAGPNPTDAERLDLAFDVACELDEILAGLRTWAMRDASRNPLALIDSLPHVDPDMRDRVASRIGRA